MKELLRNYSVEVDSIQKDAWNDAFERFNDANIYQTWSYDQIRCGNDKISHLILRKNGAMVAMAQARIAKIPGLNAGIAYVRWGPLWRLKETETEMEIFQQAVRALKNEYAGRRGLVLRIYPLLFSDESEKYLPVLEEDGFVPLEGGKQDRTLIIDLKRSLEDLRKGLNQKWRNSLNRAERNALEVIDGDNDELFQMFIVKIYRNMVERKQFRESNDINEFRLIQQDLPDALKMKIILCRVGGELCSGAIFSAMGNAGIYLFGATNDIGMKTNGSYLLQWKFIEWLKENHFTCYDLNGINPEINPGTYRFKEGLCGKNGKDVYFLGQFEANGSLVSNLSVGIANKLLSISGSVVKKLHNIRRHAS